MTKDFVENRTTGFDEWAAHIMGRQGWNSEDAGVGREQETGVPAREIRALAREWGSGNAPILVPAEWVAGSVAPAAPRPAAQWARMMVILMAMQGLGRPGVNFGNLQQGAPLDYTFWFPGYAEGGISGDLNNHRCGPRDLPAECRMS